MKSLSLVYKPLALLVAMTLAACGGGGSSGGSEPAPAPTPPTHAVTVKQAAGAPDSRLVCLQGTGEKACDLRMYQIMVEAFVNGDDTINYSVAYGPSQHKGDLQGIINSLDYIKSTGVNAIWLTPIFDSCAGRTADPKLEATGYFACDYFNVDPKFGTSDKLKELVDTAHAKGLYVLLDGVFGHSSGLGVVSQSPNGLKPTFTTTKTSLCTPSSTQSCVDYTAPDSLAFFKEVATHYVTRYGIDGWRLDQAYQVPNAAWNEIRTAVEAAAAARKTAGETWGTLGYMVAEQWGDESFVSAIYGSKETPALKSAFEFPLYYGVLQALGAEASGKTGDATSLYASWNDGDVYPSHAMPNLMSGNHDVVRFGDLLQRSNLANPSDEAYWTRHKSMFSFMAAKSGPITFYYGDEIGDELPGFANQVTTNCSAVGQCDDHVSRTDAKIENVTPGFTPSAAQLDLKNYVAKLMKLRDDHPALRNGARTPLFTDTNVYLELKDAGTDHVLFALNTKTIPAVVTVSAAALKSSGALTDLLAGGEIALVGDQYEITLAPLTARFFGITP